jgi:threonine/homoserine/homoserine lactone efflux protein
MKKESARSQEARDFKENSFGVASFVLGLIALLSNPIAAIILGVFGFIFGMKQKRMHPNRWATWGIVLSILALAFAIFLMAVCNLNPGLCNQAFASFTSSA